MPSQATIHRRSSSDPDLTNYETRVVQRSSRCRSSASSSSRPTKFSYWTSWSNINKLGDHINPSRRRSSNASSSSSRHSDLTEENLDAHNKLHGMLSHKAHIKNFIISTGASVSHVNVDEKNKSSPYYKGLIDLTLSINRERNIINNNNNMCRFDSPDPERASHTTTTAFTNSSSGSLSSFFVRMQEFGSSCFTCTSRNKDVHYFPAATAAAQKVAVKPMLISSSSILTSPKEMVIRSEEKKQEGSRSDPPGGAQLVETGRKPLRERVSVSDSDSEPSASTLVLPAKTVIVSNDDKKLEEGNYQLLQQQPGNPKFVWADKYRPKALKDFICNRSQAARLQALVKEGGLNHVILEGPPGVGKRTMIWAMLREAFGPDRVQTRDECKAFDLKGESIGRIKVNVKESPKHVEVNLSDIRGYEKHVIVDLMKEATQSKSSTSTSTCSSASASTSISSPSKAAAAADSYPDNCRAIILCEADNLTADALLYVRWLLERYKGPNKVFFCCSDVSQLHPITSICTLIQLLPPSKQEIVEVLEFICTREGINLPRKLAEKIADSSKNNLRQAIRSLEACWHSSYPFEEDQIILTGWEEDIANIAKNIVEERSPKQLYIIRGKLQTLIEHDVSPDFIFRSLVAEVKKHLHENLHPQVDCLYDEYNRDDEGMIESEDEMGTKIIDPERKSMRIFLRIEEFIARFMSWYNNQSKMANYAGNTTTPLAGPAHGTAVVS